MIRVVLDTNVLISGLFWRGLPNQVVRMAKVGTIQAVSSGPLMEELKEVLGREDKPFHLSTDDVARVLEDVHSWTEEVEVDELPLVCRDVKDNMVLATAESGHVNFLITGDVDLLSLRSYSGLRIMDVRTFIEEICPVAGFTERR